MSPEQIEAVRARWARALRHPDALVAAVAAALADTAGASAGCARWGVDAITRLVLVLDRPTAFPTVAEVGSARRPRVTVHEIDLVGDALRAALRRLTGELDAAEEHAWALALALFRDLVVAPHLTPFPIPTTTTTAGPARPDHGEQNP